MGIREITKKSEDLREYRKSLERQKITLEQFYAAVSKELREAYAWLREVSKQGEDGNPAGDVQSAMLQVKICEAKKTDLESRLRETESEIKQNTEDAERLISDIDIYTGGEEYNIDTLNKLSRKKYSGNTRDYAAEIIARMNKVAEERDLLQQSIGKSSDSRRYSNPVNSYMTSAQDTDRASKIIKINGDSYRVDDNGQPHMKRGDDNEYHVLPNIKYVVNGYTYQTDDKGRIIHVEGNLKVKEGRRAPLNAKVSDMEANDQRGHIIADLFWGSNQNDNLIAQLKNINQGAYKSLEISLANLIGSGNSVHGNYTIEYPDDSGRPSAITVNFSVNDGALTSQKETFSKLGLQDTESFSEFENELFAMRDQGHKVECNYSVIFDNYEGKCWLMVEYTIDGSYPTLTQFV